LREEEDAYPTIVFREAIVNSLVHRNYSIVGSKIRILMFTDRIEFHSPGSCQIMNFKSKTSNIIMDNETKNISYNELFISNKKATTKICDKPFLKI